ncbi:MAG: acyl-ACP--UDP-N-acetylglucosamine O-acyltransferase [Thermoguttaceae bacterium]|nr:acyl-ACP--UDP-N-acetylglucosamine O-acyltransferase [Thermoguttaceae bacterium]MDW8078499.1 acyl-ACP--UDP-N-acetylglucosamine O-acyltransferase [Thermoguttaceae bacterium]
MERHLRLHAPEPDDQDSHSAETFIHPTAVVSRYAVIGKGVYIGPFALVEGETVIGNGCRLEAHAVIKEGVILGPNNHVFEGAVIGGLPQHIHMPERPGKVIVGAGNVIREHVTIHRALDEHEATVVGDNNLLMVNAHVAHDCRLGNGCILANNVMLAGHVSVGDRAYLSGAVAVHQFCRIGPFAMVGGHARVGKDIPPYVTVDGFTTLVVGLNIIGLRRAGFTVEQISQLKEAYRIIYRSGLSWQAVLETLKERFPEGPAAILYQFLCTTTRGITPERHRFEAWLASGQASLANGESAPPSAAQAF